MAARPATAVIPIGSAKQHHMRRQQQHSVNGVPARTPALRSLHSHPPPHSSTSSTSSQRPRFSPYTPPLSSSVPITSHRSGRMRHATVSSDADITDPRIYPTELSSSRDQREAHAAAMSRSYDCAFFSAGVTKGHGRRGEFIIHPEWLSESVSIERLRINERPLIMPTGSQLHQQQQQHRLQHQHSVPANWPKRCKSAPPPPQQQQQQGVNPITWQ